MTLRPFIASVLFVPSVLASEILIQSPDELVAALRDLKTGTTLKIAPGNYPGGHSVSGVEKLTIEALDPKQPPHFRGGANAWHFSRCKDLSLRNLRLSGQTGNGLNLDDGGDLANPTTGITIEHVEISDIGPKGNHDGIKCSGLDQLTIRDCAITGWGGQGIDFVGYFDDRADARAPGGESLGDAVERMLGWWTERMKGALGKSLAVVLPGTLLSGFTAAMLGMRLSRSVTLGLPMGGLGALDVFQNGSRVACWNPDALHE